MTQECDFKEQERTGYFCLPPVPVQLDQPAQLPAQPASIDTSAYIEHQFDGAAKPQPPIRVPFEDADQEGDDPRFGRRRR